MWGSAWSGKRFTSLTVGKRIEKLWCTTLTEWSLFFFMPKGVSRISEPQHLLPILGAPFGRIRTEKRLHVRRERCSIPTFRGRKQPKAAPGSEAVCRLAGAWQKCRNSPLQYRTYVANAPAVPDTDRLLSVAGYRPMIVYLWESPHLGFTE